MRGDIIRIVIFLFLLASIGIFSPRSSFAQEWNICGGTFKCCKEYGIYGECIDKTEEQDCSGGSSQECTSYYPSVICNNQGGLFPVDNNCSCQGDNCEAFCSFNNKIQCETGCVPDVTGGSCFDSASPLPHCTKSRKAECLTRFNYPFDCEPDLSGGKCVSVTYSEADCLTDCFISGFSYNQCVAGVCSQFREGALACSPTMENTCARYRTPHECQPDSLGGHCVPIESPLKPNGDVCDIDSECVSGRCDFSGYGLKICVSAQKCTPGEFVPRDPNTSLSCSWTCPEEGNWWTRNKEDCTPYFPEKNKFCEGNIIIYEDPQTGARLHQLCEGDCAYGTCVLGDATDCQPGLQRLIEGSCEGISGCPFSFPGKEYSGNCMAVCSTQGEWEVGAGCGTIDISPDFNNEERYEILTAASKFDSFLFSYAHLQFDRSDSYFVEELALIEELRNLISNYGGEYSSGGACAGISGVLVPIIQKNVKVADCGASQYTYAHEITHYISSQFPDKQQSYNIAVGCETHLFSSELYSFENEQPVTGYASSNCQEAMAEAAEMYQEIPCEMKSVFPIQYEWMKDNFYTGEESCDLEFRGYLPQVPGKENSVQALACYLDGSIKEEESQSNLIIAKLKEWVEERFEVSAANFSPHTGQFTIGYGKNEIISELGLPKETIFNNGLEILTYDSGDVSQPNVFIFSGDAKLVYYRLTSSSLTEEYQDFESFTSAFNNPEAIVTSNIQRFSTRLMYSREGFTLVVNDETGDVLQYEAFLPVYLEEYLDTWGQDIEKVLVEYPNNAISGDIDRDGDVDLDDYSKILAEFGNSIVSVADVDTDGDVDIFDYNTLVSNFGKKG